jgi:hypothetical protein
MLADRALITKRKRTGIAFVAMIFAPLAPSSAGLVALASNIITNLGINDAVGIIVYSAVNGSCRCQHVLNAGIIPVSTIHRHTIKHVHLHASFIHPLHPLFERSQS